MSAGTPIAESKALDDILVVDGLASQYAGGITGVQNVSLRLARGEILAIVGPNGAGKTTLMRAIANLLPAERGRVTAGKIIFEGLDATLRRCDALVRAGLASVLEGRHCFASLTLEENLLTGAAAQGIRPKRRPPRPRPHLRSLSKPRDAPAAPRLAGLRRRAADDGDRPRADVAADAPAAR